VRHERGEAKIDHLVKDWLRLSLIFHHQAWMTEANARGVDEACRERCVSRMKLACRHATRDYLFKYLGHALVVLAHDRPVFSYRGCDPGRGVARFHAPPARPFERKILPRHVTIW
jgi:hypothetical protein